MSDADKKRLLQKFLDDGCDPSEADLALQIIEREPALLEELLPMAEWHEGSGDSAKGADWYVRPKPQPGIQSRLLSSDMEQQIWDVVSQETIRPDRRARVLALVTRMAVAASVSLILFFGIRTWYGSNAPANDLAQQHPVMLPSEQFDTILNQGKGIQTLRLADGSDVMLASNASVIYPTEFGAKRNIQLLGQASFKVAKDAAHPFTVTSNGISTTALGTQFTVDAEPGAGSVNVRLYEGRVVVRSTSAEIPEIFLQPGEQCLVNLERHTAKVTRIQSEQTAVRVEKRESSEKVKTSMVSLRFRQEPLSAVFEKLTQKFGRPIQYDPETMNGLRFTGDFDADDRLPQILRLIGTMNDLLVSEEEGGIRITNKRTKATSVQTVVSTDANQPLSPVATNGQTETSPGESKIAADSTAKHEASAKKEVSEMNEAFAKNETSAKSEAAAKLEPATSHEATVTETSQGLVHRQSSLAAVFDRIAKDRRIIITYDPELVKNRQFTGTVPTDKTSLHILPIICRMNGLRLIKDKPTRYRVVKADTNAQEF